MFQAFMAYFLRFVVMAQKQQQFIYTVHVPAGTHTHNGTDTLSSRPGSDLWPFVKHLTSVIVPQWRLLLYRLWPWPYKRVALFIACLSPGLMHEILSEIDMGEKTKSWFHVRQSEVTVCVRDFRVLWCRSKQLQAKEWRERVKQWQISALSVFVWV